MSYNPDTAAIVIFAVAMRIAELLNAVGIV